MDAEEEQVICAGWCGDLLYDREVYQWEWVGMEGRVLLCEPCLNFFIELHESFKVDFKVYYMEDEVG